MSKTFSPTPEDIQRDWYVVDAAGIPLGRLASVVARMLSGKNKPTWAPHLDGGDFVIVINAEKTVLTGRKEDQKVYYRHTGYPGGIKSETAERLRQRKPEQMIEKAVKGMLPKNRMGRHQMRKLRVYAGSDHRHGAQQPKPFDVRAALAG